MRYLLMCCFNEEYARSSQQTTGQVLEARYPLFSS
jgi:hypothetical protein